MTEVVKVLPTPAADYVVKVLDTGVDVRQEAIEYRVVVQGVQGPPGPPGDNSGTRKTIDLAYPGTLGGHRIVVSLDGTAAYADAGDPSHLGKVVGITDSAATGTVPVVFSGEIVEPTWAWTPGPVFVGTGGVPTQSPPSSGFQQQIGTALTATRLLVQILPPIVLS